MAIKISTNSEIFTRAVEEVVTQEELKKLLGKKKQIRVKLGIDATAPELHIGHAVNLWKIRALQEMGHKAVIILGDFTTRIGDPTGHSKTRPVLTPKEIEKNIKAIRKQIEGILLRDKKVYELRRNSEWYKRMRVGELLNLGSLVTHARLIERDMFQERIRRGEKITVPELLYPILQGYDSVMVKSDLTIIGSDQLFNEHMGRFFQEKFNQKPQVIVTLKLLPGIDGGEKMSKSLGNYIGLGDSSRDKFGKAMRILDPLIIPYLKVYTDVPMEKIRQAERELRGGRNPMRAKLFFAEALVCRYHGKDTARKERKVFMKTFSQGVTPEDVPVLKIKYGLWDPVELLVAIKFAPSKSEARRLITQRGVRINDETVNGSKAEVDIKSGALIQIGKRRFVRVR